MLVLGGFGSVLGLCCCGFDFVVALRWFGGLLGWLLWVVVCGYLTCLKVLLLRDGFGAFV